MLTPNFKATLKSTPTPGGVLPGQPMTPEQAQAWIGGTSSPSSGIFSQITDAAKAGISKIGQGIQEAKPVGGGGIGGLVEGVGKIVGGAAETVTSPLAPVLNPTVGAGINAIGNKIGDIPAVQKFAQTPAGEITGKVAGTVADYANAAGTVAGAAGLPEGISSALEKGKGAIQGAKESISNVLPKAPEKTPSTAQANATAAIDSEVRNTAAKYHTVGKVLNASEVTRGTKPIDVLSSYPSGKALPTLIKGKLQVDPAVNFLKSQISRLSDIKSKLVETGKEVVPVKTFQQAAFDRIDTQNWSAAKKLQQKTEVQNILKNLQQTYPDGIPNSEMDLLKSEHANESTAYNSKSPFSPDAHAIIGQTAADSVVTAGGKAPIDELNQLLASHYDAIKLLNAMRGKTPHGGALSKMFNNTLGEVAGLAGGMAVGHPFIGAMVGRAGAEAINEIINNHFISNPLKRSIVSNMKGADPGVVQAALDYLKGQEASPTGQSAPAPATTGENSPSVESNPSSSESSISPKESQVPKEGGGGPNPLNRGFIKNPFFQDASKRLAAAKGLTAEDIVAKHPDIQLTKDVPATDIHGNKIVIPEGEALTPYELKGNKVLLKDGQTYVVSKNQYANIKGNAVSGEAKPFAPELKGTEETVMGHNYDEKIYNNYVKDLKAKYDPTGRLNMTMLYDELSATEKAKFDAMKAGQEVSRQTATKFSSYQLPGGKNYKEILIKAPLESGKVPEGQYIVNSNKDGTYSAIGSDGKELARSRYIDFNLPGLKQADQSTHIDAKGFKSSHWDEPNVISHLRLNERTYQGKPVTFMEELQSDWAREGRSKGFINDGKPDQIALAKSKLEQKGLKIEQDMSGEGLLTDKKGDIVEYDSLDANTQSLVDTVIGNAETFADMPKGKIPNNPLLKNWTELSVKRALQEAVANKSDYFAWINGEQTSARYNLATQVDSVKWDVGKNGFDGKMIYVNAKEGRDIIVKIDESGKILKGRTVPNEWEGKTLDQAFGKGLADKIMAEDKGTLAGEGLKFGGEWANNLYDKQVKNIVEDVTGGKVQTLDMGLPIEAKSDKLFTHNGLFLKKDNLKVGMEVTKGAVDDYIITDVLGDGKFKAVPKDIFEKAKSIQDFEIATIKKQGTQGYGGAERRAEIEKVKAQDLTRKMKEVDKQTFDISTKKTTQQGIKLTPQIKAKIQGEAPPIKKPSGSR